MPETINPRAGKPIDPSSLVNVPRLVTAYFTGTPDPAIPAQRVAFGTSGHRGSAFDNAFNETHILAITPGDLRSPGSERHRRAPVHRHRHPCAVHPRPGERAGGAGRQRGRDDDRRSRAATPRRRSSPTPS